MFEKLTDTELDTLLDTLDRGANRAYRQGDFLGDLLNQGQNKLVSARTATAWIKVGNELRDLGTMVLAHRYPSW
jgi:hypothetical protein